MENYYPNSQYSDGLQVGAEYLDFVMDALYSRGIILQPYQSRKYQFNRGESRQGWEVKLDTRCTDTGRLSIEIAEKHAAAQTNWIPSGAYKNDSWLYIQGNYSVIYIFMTKILRGLHQSGRFAEHELPTVRAFYLPLPEAAKYGHVIEVGSNGQSRRLSDG